MAAESWSLNGLSLTSGTFEMIELTADPPAARYDWITAADSEAAALMRKPLHENRTITTKLRVNPQASMDAALDAVGSLVDKLNSASDTPEGITLAWTPVGSTRTRSFFVLAGQVTNLPIGLADDGIMWLLRQQPIIQVEMTCAPYWFGTTVSMGNASASTPFVTLEADAVAGDIPALGQLIITDLATQSRRHVEWGLEGPLTYNVGAVTSLLVDSDDMVTTGFSGTQTTATGAYDPNATGNSCITMSAIPGAVTAIAGTGDLQHLGRFRVKARVQSGSTDNLFRLSWRSGSGPMNHNEWVPAILSSGWQELDLGSITVEPTVTFDTQHWVGQVEILGADTSPGTILLDYLVLVPQSDGYGKARGIYAHTPGVVTGWDQFTGTTAGTALSGRTAPLGGSWTTAGATTDFAFADDLGGEQIKRTATSGARFGVLGSAVTDTEVGVTLTGSSLSGVETGGALARYVDTSNYLAGYVNLSSASKLFTLTAIVGGSAAAAVTVTADDTGGVGSSSVTLKLIAYATGHAILLGYIGGVLIALLELADSSLATAGTLASGKSGVYDNGTGGTRWYDDFSISTPADEPIALYSGQIMNVRYDGVIRYDSAGTHVARPPSYVGGRLVVPPGTSRVLVKARRNDIDVAADDHVTDNTKIELFVTPRGLVVPR